MTTRKNFPTPDRLAEMTDYICRFDYVFLLGDSADDDEDYLEVDVPELMAMIEACQERDERPD